MGKLNAKHAARAATDLSSAESSCSTSTYDCAHFVRAFNLWLRCKCSSIEYISINANHLVNDRAAIGHYISVMPSSVGYACGFFISISPFHHTEPIELRPVHDTRSCTNCLHCDHRTIHRDFGFVAQMICSACHGPWSIKNGMREIAFRTQCTSP